MKIFKVEKPIKLSKFLLESYGAELSYGALQKLIRDNFKEFEVKTIKYNPYNYKPKKLLENIRKVKRN